MLEFTSLKSRAVVLVVTGRWRSDGSSIGCMPDYRGREIS
jgi:hypothetical protein